MEYPNTAGAGPASVFSRTHPYWRHSGGSSGRAIPCIAGFQPGIRRRDAFGTNSPSGYVRPSASRRLPVPRERGDHRRGLMVPGRAEGQHFTQARMVRRRARASANTSVRARVPCCYSEGRVEDQPVVLWLAEVSRARTRNFAETCWPPSATVYVRSFCQPLLKPELFVHSK